MKLCDLRSKLYSLFLLLVLFVLALVLAVLAAVLFALAVLLFESEKSLYPLRHGGCCY